MVYLANFEIEEPYVHSVLTVFTETRGSKTTSSVSIDVMGGNRLDISRGIEVLETGKRVTIWISGGDAALFTGKLKPGGIADRSWLTAGKWEMVTLRDTSTPGVKFGSEDTCGVDSRDRMK